MDYLEGVATQLGRPRPAASKTLHGEPQLSIRDLEVTYQPTRGGDPVAAVRGVSLDVYAGEMTAVVGESGSGKSTTALAALGLLPGNATIEQGAITLLGKDVTNLSNKQWRRLRGTDIALIPQDPNNSLNPLKTIGASVGEGLAIARRGSAAERKARVLELLDQVGIDDPARRYDQYPHELSGGMKQRALIAAAMSLEPQVIIADEPTSALDVTVQKVILDLLDDMRHKLGLGILFITHDLAVAGDRADHVVVMQQGQVQESGLAASVLTNPQAEYSRKLLADAPSLSTPKVQRTAPVQALHDAPLVDVRNLHKEFGDFTAVQDMSFTVARGTTHAIVGESGSGKTTTGRMISGFTRPTSGSVTIAGTDVTALSKEEIRKFRSTIQLVYQNPYSSLDPRRTIAQSIAEPLVNLTQLKKPEIAAKVEKYLDLVALPLDAGARRPAELSGGQRQRVAIARAMIIEPEVLVLDEAVSALDVTVQAQILQLLDDFQRESGVTYLFISHDLSVVRQISDTVSVMYRGQHVEHGATADVFENPQSDYTRTLLDAIPGQRYRAGELNLGL
ncbi:dipeptide ABC transporter ATP-binding protein [Corynebacterium renale]|uniref:Peptide/nickel transport system ATP-binding protein n=1 Tax=Corynebacterium renale TaxID=1724 RepID=A0A2A9DNJ5_9CORY|nr:ABC transporter ATP-binding protein [Corynebacterium renale]PFG28174.1 peptide/nickel transport system ATP-binding protein [Corynebacterium renale]SQI20197.1 ABC transporter ATP-binding protein [Corynebacterium renale]